MRHDKIKIGDSFFEIALKYAHHETLDIHDLEGAIFVYSKGTDDGGRPVFYQDDTDEFMFIQAGPGVHAFLCLNTGNRLFDPINLSSPEGIIEFEKHLSRKLVLKHRNMDERDADLIVDLY